MATLKTSFGQKQEWRNKAIAYLVDELTKLGQAACKEAIARKGYKNRKYNLHDSIGSAVYVHGRIVPSSRRYAVRPMSTGTFKDRGSKGSGMEMTGREALDRYWASHSTIPYTNAVELVVIAGTFYSGILENRGIQVISAAKKFASSRLAKYKSYNPKVYAKADLVEI